MGSCALSNLATNTSIRSNSSSTRLSTPLLAEVEHCSMEMFVPAHIVHVATVYRVNTHTHTHTHAQSTQTRTHACTYMHTCTHSAREFMAFTSDVLVGRTAVGQRQTVKEQGTLVHLTHGTRHSQEDITVSGTVLVGTFDP